MVKTDFKNTYEAFMHCDKNKLAKEFAAMYSDNEEQAAAVKEIDRAFARMETVTPKAVNPDEQSIIVVCKGFGDEGDDTVCIEVRDLRNWKEKHTKISEPISDEMLTCTAARKRQKPRNMRRNVQLRHRSSPSSRKQKALSLSVRQKLKRFVRKAWLKRKP